MPKWVKVARERDLPLGGRKVVRIKGRRVVLLNVEGELYALDNVCPHAGGPLNRGDLDGYLLICPWHDWAYDVRTGQLPDNPKIGVRTYPIRIDRGKIYLGWPEEDGSRRR